MTESTATKLTSLCTAAAALGALVALMVNSGAPVSAGGPSASASAVVRVAD
jgi:hypothetical protein